jgi:hypothetical protein
MDAGYIRVTRANTPTAGGYFAAAVISIGVVMLLDAAISAATVSAWSESAGESLRGIVTVSIMAGIYATLAAMILGLPLTLVAHRLLRENPSRAVHVLAFSAVGLITGAVVVFGVFGGPSSFSGAEGWLLVFATGVSTAIGRLLAPAQVIFSTCGSAADSELD